MKKLLIFVLVCTLSAASYPPIKSRDGLAISSHELATKVGQDVLERGGNAIDAAVAMGYALAVVHPAAGNIGGGGFALIHLANGKNISLDFREKAPLKSSKNMYLDKNGEVIKDLSTIGYLAAGVPGSVKGFSAMLDKYGTKKLSELIMPAIKLAEGGFIITQRQAQTLKEMESTFKLFSSSKKYFLNNGNSYKEGQRLVQKDLANTLKLIAKNGPSAFYTGAIADLIVKDMQRNKGIISKEDLAQYSVAWREPVIGEYRGHKIVSMGPPSSGGVHIIEILNTIENAPIDKIGFNNAESIHLISEAMRQAYADRSVFMGDPDFVKIPLKTLIDKKYAKKIFDNIKSNAATDSKDIKPGLGDIKEGDGEKIKQIHEGNNTTHYSVADKFGNAVSVTYTINASYGSGAAVEGAGFLLNNEMDDFSIKPGVPNLCGLVGGEANAIEPNKRPLSSMSPTMVFKDDKLLLVVGSPGGARIITTVLQVIVNVIDHKMDIARAVQSPRFHMQWLPDEIRVEKFGLSRDSEKILKDMGYKVVELPDMGDVNAIEVQINKSGKIFYGSGDPREEF